MVQPNLTLGTAGHIDHGKTSLVKFLTGCETDRLKEEKERGMSIDLGFAPCTIGDLQVGIVDVPGHENFVKTMVAGASGMDGVILVVAADDGVMPQTREHLDILTLLGIRHGIVALTKVDRVDADHLQLVREELEAFFRGTFLEGAPILSISNLTGQGFDPFFTALVALIESIQPKRTDGVFRVPVDRAFSAKGHGCIVAGIPVSGSARVGDEVVLLPQGLSGQIRQIQVYGRPSDAVQAGQCAAINVRHWDQHQIGRGDTITLPGFFAADEWYAGTIRLLPQEKLVLKNGTGVKFHTGTTEVPAVVYSIEGGAMHGGGEYLVQIRAQQPIVAGPGDHFILRTLSPVRTVGGGTIIEATGRRLKHTRPGVCEDLRERAAAIGDESRFVEYCVRRAETLAAGEAEVAVRTKIPHARIRGMLAALSAAGRIMPLDAGGYIHRDTAEVAGKQVLDAVGEFHRQSPESPGIAVEPLRLALPLEKPVLDGLISLLKTQGRLVERNQRLALAEHQARFGQQGSEQVERIEALFREAAFHPPSAAEAAEQTGLAAEAVAKSLRILREHQRLVAVEDLLFHCTAIDRAKELLIAHFRQEARLESVDFKYLLDTTRKYALPLLDYFDRIGVTRRQGNTRYLKMRV